MLHSSIIHLVIYANNLILVNIHQIIISIYRGLKIQLDHFADWTFTLKKNAFHNIFTEIMQRYEQTIRFTTNDFRLQWGMQHQNKTSGKYLYCIWVHHHTPVIFKFESNKCQPIIVCQQNAYYRHLSVRSEFCRVILKKVQVAWNVAFCCWASISKCFKG
jgi:hypothetical protein